jgi:spermidine/putrescine transport system substrate-binding protein
MRLNITSLSSRTLIFSFWVVIIGLFLMVPTIINYFRQEKSLTIFTWPLLLDPIKLKEFEQQTGIKLYITYFENGPALLSKLAATKGKGYDLIIPDDHSLELLIQQGLLKKIDHKRLSFWPTMNPVLLGNYYDPTDAYSIPYYWGVYGIGYDTDVFTQGPPPATWATLFDKNFALTTRLCMTDDPREAIMITAFHLFGTIEALKDPIAQQKVKEALIEQKKLIEVYTISRSDNLLQSKSCGLAAIMSPDVWRLQRENPNVQMVVPQEGSFIVVDAIAIPKATQKDDMIYEFLNYLYQPSVIEHHVNLFGYCSPITSVGLPGQEAFCLPDDFKKFDFFRTIIPDEQINALWIEVLAA